MGGKWSKHSMGGWSIIRGKMKRLSQQQMGWEQHLETWQNMEQSQIAIQQILMLIVPG
nr:premature stop codon [Human immunodeficiency virus 1]